MEWNGWMGSNEIRVGGMVFWEKRFGEGDPGGGVSRLENVRMGGGVCMVAAGSRFLASRNKEVGKLEMGFLMVAARGV